MSQSYLEINGRFYDPSSGAPVVSDEPIGPASEPEQPAETLVDDEASKSHRPHQLASHAKAHSVQPSRTLNRKSVKKPTASKKPRIKTGGLAEQSLAPPAASGLIKKSTAKVGPDRQTRAHLAGRSDYISKFGKRSEAAGLNRTPYNSRTGTTFDIAPPPRRPAAAIAAPAPSIASAPPKSQFGRMLERQESESRHHYLESPRTKKSLPARLKPGHKRAASFIAVGLTILLVAGFIVWQNETNIKLQLADAKAGVKATLPDKVPAGYSVANLSYQPGQVAINFRSSQDGHHFQLIQKASGYTNTSALVSLLGSSSKTYQTYDAGGRIVYVASTGGSASAVWLDGGILHLVEGNASLSPSQLVELASST